MEETHGEAVRCRGCRFLCDGQRCFPDREGELELHPSLMTLASKVTRVYTAILLTQRPALAEEVSQGSQVEKGY